MINNEIHRKDNWVLILWKIKRDNRQEIDQR